MKSQLFLTSDCVNCPIKSAGEQRFAPRVLVCIWRHLKPLAVSEITSHPNIEHYLKAQPFVVVSKTIVHSIECTHSVL